MDNAQLPKNLVLFLEDIYKTFPAVEKHPDYNFYYLYVDHPTISEYLFCVIDDFLYNSPLAEKLNESLFMKGEFYGFTNASIVNILDFEFIKNLVDEKYREIKKTRRTILFYQVW